MDWINVNEKKKIDTYRVFKSEVEKSKYIDLLDKELAVINSLSLDISAKEIYRTKYDFPEAVISKRCLDFKELEQHAKDWLIK